MLASGDTTITFCRLEPTQYERNSFFLWQEIALSPQNTSLQFLCIFNKRSTEFGLRTPVPQQSQLRQPQQLVFVECLLYSTIGCVLPACKHCLTWCTVCDWTHLSTSAEQLLMKSWAVFSRTPPTMEIYYFKHHPLIYNISESFSWDTVSRLKKALTFQSVAVNTSKCPA